jgi:GH25 family lysozyme M1 (1,4-beta-N-acetylmuramidase)
MLPEYPHGNTAGRYATLVAASPRLPPGRLASRPYDFHQYTPAGQVPGISGPVDRSIWIGTPDELRLWHATGQVPTG